VVDDEGRLTYANAALAEMLGYPVERLVSNHYAMKVAASPQQPYAQVIADTQIQQQQAALSSPPPAASQATPQAHQSEYN
jgi:PAS domain-containing protein